MKNHPKINSSAKKWFELELERRGIDASIHFEYIMSLVEDCCGDCISDISNKGISTLSQKMSMNEDHWEISENRDIAIQMLESLSNSLRKRLVRNMGNVSPLISDAFNGNLKGGDDSLEVKNLESKFEQLAVLWMPTDRSPSADNNRSIWSYESTSSDSGPPSPRFQQQIYDDIFGTTTQDGHSSYCQVPESTIWATGTNAVDEWLNQEMAVQRKIFRPWSVQRKCSLDNHVSTSLFKEVTSKKLDFQVEPAYSHQLPSVPDVMIFDENLLTSPKTHFQPIKNDSWQREVSIIIDSSRKGLVPCSPQCPNRVTSRSNSSDSRVVQPPRPSSVSSKELASFIESGCDGDPEELVEKFVVVEDVLDEVEPVQHAVDPPVVEVDDNDENEYQAIESILNAVLNDRPVDGYEVDSVELDQVDVNNTYTSMPWNEELLQDLNNQIMTTETVYLTDDSDDYFLHRTSDVDSSLDFHNDPALLFVYKRPGGLPSSCQYSKPCSFFLEGNCRKSDCKYSHDFKSIQCKFWLEGSCFKGDSCPFLHSNLLLPGGNCDEPSLKDFSMNDMDFPSLAVESSTCGMKSYRESDKAKSEWIRSGLTRTRTTSRESPPVTFRLQVGRKKKKKGGSHPKVKTNPRHYTMTAT